MRREAYREEKKAAEGGDRSLLLGSHDFQGSHPTAGRDRSVAVDRTVRKGGASGRRRVEQGQSEERRAAVAGAQKPTRKPPECFSCRREGMNQRRRAVRRRCRTGLQRSWRRNGWKDMTLGFGVAKKK